MKNIFTLKNIIRIMVWFVILVKIYDHNYWISVWAFSWWLAMETCWELEEQNKELKKKLGIKEDE